MQQMTFNEKEGKEFEVEQKVIYAKLKRKERDGRNIENILQTQR